MDLAPLSSFYQVRQCNRSLCTPGFGNVTFISSVNFPVSPGSQPKVSPGRTTDVAKVPQGQWYDATVYFFPSFLFFPLRLAFVSALTMQDGRFLRAQRYPDEYEEDSYPVLPSRMRDLYGEEDEDRSRPMDSSFPAVQRQYAIGRGPPPGHGRSMSIHFDESPNMNTQAAGRRSRSAHMSGPRDASGADAPIRMDDLESLFHRFSLQQEERHREVTQGLEARLNSLEQCSHAPPRSAGASSAPIVLPESDEGPTGRGDSIGAALQEEADADDEADDSKKKKPKYHTAIQRYTTITFRGACGVRGTEWPDTAAVRVNPATGVNYLSPFFECDVTDPRNHAICVAVAGTVDREMKDNLPPGVPETAVWDSTLLLKSAKQSFRTCKASWKKVYDAEAAKRAAINDRNTRRYRRRCTKYTHVKSQFDAYAAKLRIPRSVVEDLLSQELLSDEASGPEDDADETFDAWKVRMAAAAGHKNLTAAALKKEHFVEVLECPWRSDELSIISSSMQTLYTTALNASGGAPIKYTRVPTSTHRKSSYIPSISPWDFGISSQWLDEQRNNPELSNWGTHGNPTGCNWEEVRIVRIDATGEKVVDSRFDFEGLTEAE
ncbi:hypothetical protein DFH08DRAFT_857814 [Mycena albidolilacea]|uniref:Uncharacterized protein n=1 Tax=Mycena albidolilacea TaxID=1033008 RepID=A0AAD7A8F6_9AGAR|nr:hypothetical protein DFH08DRAFT_857814 [Mycena albidolilacea]